MDIQDEPGLDLFVPTALCLEKHYQSLVVRNRTAAQTISRHIRHVECRRKRLTSISPSPSPEKPSRRFATLNEEDSPTKLVVCERRRYVDLHNFSKQKNNSVVKRKERQVRRDVKTHSVAYSPEKRPQVSTNRPEFLLPINAQLKCSTGAKINLIGSLTIEQIQNFRQTIRLPQTSNRWLLTNY